MTKKTIMNKIDGFRVELKDYLLKNIAKWEVVEVGQYRDTNYTNEYTEKDGCVYYVDSWSEQESKVCGEYIIEKHN